MDIKIEINTDSELENTDNYLEKVMEFTFTLFDNSKSKQKIKDKENELFSEHDLKTLDKILSREQEGIDASYRQRYADSMNSLREIHERQIEGDRTVRIGVGEEGYSRFNVAFTQCIWGNSHITVDPESEWNRQLREYVEQELHNSLNVSSLSSSSLILPQGSTANHLLVGTPGELDIPSNVFEIYNNPLATNLEGLINWTDEELLGEMRNSVWYTDLNELVDEYEDREILNEIRNISNNGGNVCNNSTNNHSGIEETLLPSTLNVNNDIEYPYTYEEVFDMLIINEGKNNIKVRQIAFLEDEYIYSVAELLGHQIYSSLHRWKIETI